MKDGSLFAFVALEDSGVLSLSHSSEGGKPASSNVIGGQTSLMRSF
jgi:hypothetical protein